MVHFSSSTYLSSYLYHQPAQKLKSLEKSAQIATSWSHDRRLQTWSRWPNLGPSSQTLVWYHRKGMISMLCENWTRQWRKRSYNTDPPRMKYFRPYPRMNTCRRKRRTRCTPNLRQTSGILTEVHTNVTEAILGGFIACLSRTDTTIAFRCSKSARLRPPGDEIDAFGQQNDHQTSAKPLKSFIEVHNNEMVAIYAGFIALVPKIGTTNPPRSSKSARWRPPGAVIDTIGQ